MAVNCIACAGSYHQPWGAELEECANCGLVRAQSIPSVPELTKLYQQEYFFGKEYFDYAADRPALEHNFRKRLRTLRPLLGPNTRLVEVGCAYGYFLNLVKDNVGWHQGYDVSEEGVAYAQSQLGVKASTANFLEANLPASTIDIVCMWDVIEHLPHPDAMLAEISRVLKPAGRLALTTGDISAFVPRIRGEKWRMIHPPTHLYYFAPDTLSRLLANNGLVIESLHYPSTYRNLGSVINQVKLNRRAQGKRAVGLEMVAQTAQTSGLARLNIPLNLHDIMEVVAIKQ